MSSVDFSFSSQVDGLSLKGLHWPREGAQAAVLILHGLAEHCRRYDRFAGVLNAANVEVFAYDHRGHGATAHSEREFGKFSFEALISDITGAIKAIREQSSAPKLFLFAHSMGSFAAQAFLPDGASEIDGVILSGSADYALIAQVAAAQPEAAGFAALNAGFEPARTAFDWLSRDDAEVDKYVNDPACGFDPTEETAASMLGGGAALANPDEWLKIPKNLPVYIFSGEKDPVHFGGGLFTSLVEKFRSAGISDLTDRLYPGGRHEMLNETNRDEVMGDVVAWLQKRS
ncbi:MAG: alpha/beta fold hydrolase [Pseudomonadota bacterium]